MQMYHGKPLKRERVVPLFSDRRVIELCQKNVLNSMS